MTARFFGLISIWLLVFFEGTEALGHYEINRIIAKSSNENYDYVLGPEFAEDGVFAFAKVKQFTELWPVIVVTIEMYDRYSLEVKTNKFAFGAESGSTSISLIWMKFGQFAVLSINEKQKNGEDKAIIFKWERYGSEYSYPDPSLYLPMNHTIIFSDNYNFEVVVDDNTICHADKKDKCLIQFGNNEEPKREKLEVKDLALSSMRIAKFDSSRFFIRGFDAVGTYKFLDCGKTYWRTGGCSQLLSLSNADSTIQAHPLDLGLCFIENPGNDHTAKCLKFDNEYERNITFFDRTVTYEQPMSLLYVNQVDRSEILLVAQQFQCESIHCFNIVLSRIPLKVSKPITHRYLVLGCASNGKLFKVRMITKNTDMKALIIEYTCENPEEFVFKSAIINDDSEKDN